MGRSRSNQSAGLSNSLRLNRQRRALGSVIERLETRSLLSTITWTNRGTPGNDSDGFGSVFGANAELARDVVSASFRHWARVITNFNYSNGTNTFEMTVNMATGGTSAGANAGLTSFIGDKPNKGAMTLGRGGDSNMDGIGDGVGYYLDPNPDDFIEWGETTNPDSGVVLNAFAGNLYASSPAANLGDLYTLVTHEMGHAVGFGSNTQMNALGTNTSQGDTQSPTLPGGGRANLWRFDGPSVQALATGFDSGGQAGGATDANGVQHYAPVGTTVTVVTTTYSGAVDLMNPFYSANQRKLISNADALMLGDAYGYTITQPETFGTYYANLNRATGDLYVLGGTGASSDVITINSVGSNIVVSVDLQNDIVGTGPTDAFVSLFPNDQVDRIYINSGGGTDYIRIDGTYDEEVFINAGIGDDFIDFGFGFNNVSAIDGAVEVDGGVGIDKIFIYDQGNFAGSNWTLTNASAIRSGFGGMDYTSVDELTLFTGNGVDVVSLLGTNIPMSIHTNNGSDTLSLAGGSVNTLDQINASVFFYGGAGNDELELDDHNRTANSIATLHDGYVTIPSGRNVYFDSITDLNYLGGAGNDQIFVVGGSASAVINGNGGADAIAVLGSTAVPVINGGNGNDTISIGGGDLLANTPASGNITGGPGTDTLVLNDSAANNSHPWEISSNSILFAGAIPYDYGATENVSILAGTGQNIFTVYSQKIGSSLELNGGAGGDRLQFFGAVNNFTYAGLPYEDTIHFVGGSGPDEIQVNDTARLGGIYTLTSTTYRSLEGTDGMNFSFDASTESMLLNAGNLSDTFTFDNYNFDTQVTVAGGNGFDQLYVHPDETASQTALRNITFFGGGNSDTLHVIDSDETSDVTWETQDMQVIRRKGNVAPWYVIYDTVELLNLTAGAGADQIDLLQAVSVPMVVSGGEGPDFVKIHGTGFNGFNLQPVTLSGGGHNDIIYFDDTGMTGANTWGITQSTFGRSFSPSFSYSAFEQATFQGGSGNETFHVYSTNIYTSVDAGEGNDSITVGGITGLNGGGQVNQIAAYLGVSGGGGTDSLTYNDVLATTGKKLHYDGYQAGHFPGDNFFGGGLVEAAYIENTVFNLGSGADTVYSSAATDGPATFNGNSPTIAPGDSITFAVANEVNPALVPTTADAGHLDVPGKPSVHYTGMEQAIADADGPTITGTELLFEFGHQFNVYMDESISLAPESYTLFDAVTNTPFAAGLSAASGLLGGGMGVTFAGFPNGRLDDGVYRLDILPGGVFDLDGNPLAAQSLEFFFLNADATRDRKVDTADFNILAANFAGGNVGFSRGDFSYDGAVDSLDLNVLVGQFGKRLPAASLPQGAQSPFASPIEIGGASERINSEEVLLIA